MGFSLPGVAFELKKGTKLPPLTKGRITYKHIVRWCAAQQNWDKIHYNQDYVRQKSKLPDVFINGALKQQFIVQYLSKLFNGLGWVWRVDTEFKGIDFAEQVLAVHGKIAGIRKLRRYLLVEINFEIYNSDRQKITTSGRGAVLLSHSGKQVTKITEVELPHHWRISTNPGTPEGKVAKHIIKMIGTKLESVESVYPVDLSRLRLMAEAVMDVHPWHYDPKAARLTEFGNVVALPLFPLHGIEPLPGTCPLSEDPEFIGREASNDVGRPDASFLGLDPSGIMNGGNKVEIHSLARVGERICADSQVIGASHCSSHPAGQALLLETLNRYWESEGRLLITERQTIIYRLIS
jgi:acyl dehydratase